MSARKEMEYYMACGVAEEELGIHQVDGKPRVTMTTRGMRQMLESAAASGNAIATKALEHARAEEAFRTDQGTAPDQAAKEATLDALEAFGVNMTPAQ